MESILIFSLVGFVAIGFLILNIKIFYMFIFDHKDYKLHKQIIKDIDIEGKITYDYTFHGFLPATYFKYGNNELTLILWHHEKTFSLHNDDNCLLSSFWKRKSRETYKLLCKKFDIKY